MLSWGEPPCVVVGPIRGRPRASKHQVFKHVGVLTASLRGGGCTWQNERVLFHYNGHGVPRPTSNGEIWVFNKSFTQYIPLSIYDLQSWVGSPAIYVFDCSAAGVIVNWFREFAKQRANVGPPSLHSSVQNGADS